MVRKNTTSRVKKKECDPKAHPLAGRKLVALTREEAVSVVNTCTLAVKNLDMEMPEDFGRNLEAAMNRILNTFRLKLCGCCDLVKESK